MTGDFKDESQDKDHVMDLSCNELFTVLHWRNTFKKKYDEIGESMIKKTILDSQLLENHLIFFTYHMIQVHFFPV